MFVDLFKLHPMHTQLRSLRPLSALGVSLALALSIADANHTLVAQDSVNSSVKEAAEQALPGSRATSEAESKQDRASARELSRAFRDAAARAVPSVVTIKVRTRDRDANSGGGILDVVGENDSAFDGFGSGVIITAEGLVLTNHHVVKDGKRIEVMLLDGRQFMARDVKSDAQSDLAILHIDVNEKLPTAEIGNSGELSVGDWVLAIGSPFNLHSTVSAGIISGKNRSLGGLIKGRVLQTDAAVNPGNSGGPLIDLDGKVIGINTAISSNSGAFQGVGFAIPVSRAIWVKNELLEHGRVRQARIGLELGDIPPDVRRQLDTPGAGGAFVVSVSKGRAGDRAGLMIGDVIINFDKQRIANKAELAGMIETSPVNEPIEMIIVRAGERMNVQVTLDEMKQ